MRQKQPKSKPKKTSTGFFNPVILAPVGDVFADMDDILVAGSKFLIGFYGKTYATSCATMTEARIKVWRKKIASGPVKLRDIPPTNESAGENIKRAHLQVAHWNTAITGVPPNIDPKTCRYESLKTASGSILVPSPVPPGTKDAPDEIREMIHCGCETCACLGNCKCKSTGCTVFCKCGAGVNGKNPLTKKLNAEDDDDVESTVTKDTTK